MPPHIFFFNKDLTGRDIGHVECMRCPESQEMPEVSNCQDTGSHNPGCYVIEEHTGWLGFQLIIALSADSYDAVVAEFGHLSSKT